MDAPPTLPIVLALAMRGVARQAPRLGHERREVACLAVTSGLLGLGPTVSAIG